MHKRVAEHHAAMFALKGAVHVVRQLRHVVGLPRVYVCRLFARQIPVIPFTYTVGNQGTTL